MGDAVKGILTLAELRAKMKEVLADSILTPDLEAAATHLLSAVTQDNYPSFIQAATEMSEACKRYGY